MTAVTPPAATVHIPWVGTAAIHTLTKGAPAHLVQPVHWEEAGAVPVVDGEDVAMAQRWLYAVGDEEPGSDEAPPQDGWPVVSEPPHEGMLDWLARVVGGRDALAALDALPLPLEQLDVGAFAEGERDLALAVDVELHRAASGWFVPDEALTACRRLLVAAGEAGVLRLWRDVSPTKVAAAVVHCAARTNALVGRGSGFTVAHWLRDLGATQAPWSRSVTIATAVGGSQWPHGHRPREAPEVYLLGRCDLLVGRFRSDLLAYRALAERARRQEP